MYILHIHLQAMCVCNVNMLLTNRRFFFCQQGALVGEAGAVFVAGVSKSFNRECKQSLTPGRGKQGRSQQAGHLWKAMLHCVIHRASSPQLKRPWSLPSRQTTHHGNRNTVRDKVCWEKFRLEQEKAAARGGPGSLRATGL